MYYFRFMNIIISIATINTVIHMYVSISDSILSSTISNFMTFIFQGRRWHISYCTWKFLLNLTNSTAETYLELILQIVKVVPNAGNLDPPGQATKGDLSKTYWHLFLSLLFLRRYICKKKHCIQFCKKSKLFLATEFVFKDDITK